MNHGYLRSTRTLDLSQSIWILAPVMLSALLASCGGGTAPPPAPTYNLTGRAQKGPFAAGAEITISALDATLSATGTVYVTQTTDALGNFSQSKIESAQVEIVAQGFYFDELSDELSAAQIQLKGISDLSVNHSPTVNVLTTLQEPRLKALVSQGSTYAAASTQSASEVLALFGINAGSVTSKSTTDSMRIDGVTDDDAVLLAVSMVLSQMAANSATANGTTAAAELASLINTIAAAIASTGTLTSTTFIPARDLANTQINAAAVTANLQALYATYGVSVTAPPFIEWVDQSNSGVLPQRLLPVTGLAFSAVTTANPGQLVVSNAFTVSGVGDGVVVPVTASPGMTIIENGVAVAGQYAIAKDGDTIALQVDAPGYDTTDMLAVTVGSSSASWPVASVPLGGSISGLSGTGLILQLNGANNISVAPGSSTFSFPLAIAIGASYVVTVLAPPMSPLQACFVSNGTGTVDATASSISIVCADQIAWALVANENTGAGPGNVYSNSIAPGTGVLTQVAGNPFAAGNQPSSIGVDPGGNFSYVVNLDDNTVSAYTIASATGALTPVAGSPFATGALPYSVAVDSTGHFAYVSNCTDGTISGYAIDSTTGALAAVPGSPFAVSGICPKNLTAASNGSLLYVITNGDEPTIAANINAFSIDPTTGALSPVPGNPFAATVPTSIALDPAGGFAYVGNFSISGQGSISVYTVDPTSGALAPVAGTPLVSDGQYLTSSLVDPAGKFLFAANENVSNNATALSVYAIDSVTGALTPVIGSPFTTGANPISLALEPTGSFLYVANSGIYEGSAGSVSGFSIDPISGALTPIAGSPYAAGASPSSIAIAPIH